ncbi:MAG: transglutaminase domain-containing protein [Syntrophomonadaceae bacterium]|nr:transglutaminase domain-containing protein [Syntrophomonadaceae bacterium]
MGNLARDILSFILAVLLSGILGIVTNPVLAVELNQAVVLEPVPAEAPGWVILEGLSPQDNLRLLVKKNNINKWYPLPVAQGKFSQKVWLTEGKGEYELAVMVHQAGRTYAYGPRVQVYNQVQLNPYLDPAPYIESEHKEIAALSRQLTEECTSDREKARAVHDWIVENISFDLEKYQRNLTGQVYYPDGALTTLGCRQGICIDHANLAAALLRAAGIPTRVISGTLPDSRLHAWNQAWDGQNHRWINFDTSWGTAPGCDWFDPDDFETTHPSGSDYYKSGLTQQL